MSETSVTFKNIHSILPMCWVLCWVLGLILGCVSFLIIPVSELEKDFTELELDLAVVLNFLLT